MICFIASICPGYSFISIQHVTILVGADQRRYIFLPLICVETDQGRFFFRGSIL